MSAEYAITDVCVACDICRAPCPQNAILPGAHLYGCGRDTCRLCPEADQCESQISAIRGPYSIDPRRCDGCGICLAFCVLGAIVRSDEVDKASDDRVSDDGIAENGAPDDEASDAA